MKTNFLTAAIAVLGVTLMTAPAVKAVPIAGLFNTGVDGAGAALAAGSADTHYSILVPSQAAIVIKDAIPGTWLANSATRRWVWQDINGQPTFTTLTFRTTFDLTGLDFSSASISGDWATDNTGLDILINGASTGNTCSGFSSLCNFTVASGFVAGINTLDFQVQDLGVISGFLVSSISGTANAIPEPGTLAILGLGLIGLGVTRRRKPA